MFQKNSGSEKFMSKREGEVSRFLSNFFCLTVSKNAVVETFSLSLISGIKKTRMRGWGGVSRLSGENFLSPSAKKLLV